MKKLWWFSFCIGCCWLASLSLSASTLAATPTPAPLVGGLQISQNTANVRFPENIRFELKAKLATNGPKFNKVKFSYQLIGDVATSVRSAKLEQPGKQELGANLEIDTQRDYIPPGARLSYHWILYDEAGTSYDLPAQELTYSDSRFKFQELKSGVVTVRWYQGDPNFGRAVLNKATETINKLGKLYKIEPKTPINLTVYPDVRTMFTALPPNTAEWVGGQAIPNLGTIVLAIGPGNQTEIGRSVPHEVSHQVIYQATRNPYNSPPRWLDEGLAVNNQDKVEGFLSEAFERGLEKNNLYPLRVLNGSFPADGQESYLAYAQSLKVVQYILSKYGQEGMAKILAAFKDGVSYDEAVRQGLGIGLDDLDREWKQAIGYAQAAPEPSAIAPVATQTPSIRQSITTGSTVNPGFSNTLPAATFSTAPNSTTPYLNGTVTSAAQTITACATNNGNCANSSPISPPNALVNNVMSTDQISWLVLAGLVLIMGGGTAIAILSLKRSSR